MHLYLYRTHNHIHINTHTHADWEAQADVDPKTYGFQSKQGVLGAHVQNANTQNDNQGYRVKVSDVCLYILILGGTIKMHFL